MTELEADVDARKFRSVKGVGGKVEATIFQMGICGKAGCGCSKWREASFSEPSI
jgi:hypothetical protein